MVQVRHIDIVDIDSRVQHTGASVLVLDRDGRAELMGTAVNRINEHRIFLFEMFSAQLSCTGKLILVWVEFLGKVNEAEYARTLWQKLVDSTQLLSNQLSDFCVLRKICER